jgi:RNA polymerase sigma-70 factor (ECF subfamily)
MTYVVNALQPDASTTVAPAAGTARPARVVPASFEGLFNLHYERLVRALTVVAGDREVAADAVQDAFVKAHLHWNRISGYDDPSGWVRRVAINRLRDEHRRTRRKRRALERIRSQPTASNEVPELDEFARLLAALPRQQRLTTALYYVDALSVAEIADTLGISEGTVKSHLHDARGRLRPILENEAHHD